MVGGGLERSVCSCDITALNPRRRVLSMVHCMYMEVHGIVLYVCKGNVREEASLFFKSFKPAGFVSVLCVLGIELSDCSRKREREKSNSLLFSFFSVSFASFLPRDGKPSIFRLCPVCLSMLITFVIYSVGCTWKKLIM